MANRYTGAPEVVEYNRNSYDSYYQPAPAAPVASDPRYPVQPAYYDQQVYNQNGQGYQSNFGSYKAKPYEYKYNLFSLID